MTETVLTGAGERDISPLAAWITEAGEAPLISGLREGRVAPDTLRSWLDNSIATRVLRLDGEPIAIGTLSLSEAPLPERAVEVCHVIVHPRCRRQFLGTQVVAELMRAARASGYDRVVGRVVPTNGVSHGFLSWLRWRPCSLDVQVQDGPFVWYERTIRP